MEGASTRFSQESLSNAGTLIEDIKPKPDEDFGRTSNTAASLTLLTMRHYGLKGSTRSHLLSPFKAGTRKDLLSDCNLCIVNAFVMHQSITMYIITGILYE